MRCTSNGHGRLEETDARFASEDALLVGRAQRGPMGGPRIDQKTRSSTPGFPMAHACTPSSSRCRRGTCLTIRKFHHGGLTLGQPDRIRQLVGGRPRVPRTLCAAAQEHHDFRRHRNRKTSLLGAVSAAVPEEERIVVIEDTSEINLPQEHCIYLEVQRGQ